MCWQFCRPVMARTSSVKCSFAPGDYGLDGQASILVISPLNSIIKDRISEMSALGYSAILITSIVWNT